MSRHRDGPDENMSESQKPRLGVEPPPAAEEAVLLLTGSTSGVLARLN
jgi:hypothetical protein